MKNLTALAFAGLVLIAPAFGYETDKFKYIPNGENVTLFDMNENGMYDLIWWDKNKDGLMQDNERFYDLNEDGIPDISYEEIIELYKNNEKLRTQCNLMPISL